MATVHELLRAPDFTPADDLERALEYIERLGDEGAFYARVSSGRREVPDVHQAMICVVVAVGDVIEGADMYPDGPSHRSARALAAAYDDLENAMEAFFAVATTKATR